MGKRGKHGAKKAKGPRDMTAQALTPPPSAPLPAPSPPPPPAPPPPPPPAETRKWLTDAAARELLTYSCCVGLGWAIPLVLSFLSVALVGLLQQIVPGVTQAPESPPGGTTLIDFRVGRPHNALTVFALVYNLVRAVMCVAAQRQGVAVERISFADALD